MYKLNNTLIPSSTNQTAPSKTSKPTSKSISNPISKLTLNIDNVTNIPQVTSLNTPMTPIINTDINEIGNTLKKPENQNFIIFIAIFVISIYIILSLVSSVFPSTNSDGSKTRSVIETILIMIFVLLITANAVKYFFNLDIKASLVDLFSKEPELDINVNKLGQLGGELLEEGEMLLGDIGRIGDIGGEVFNISDNIYTYEDAKGVCGAFGGRLANYFDIENAYKSGGEWCNYGWSDDQMVFYPTQRATYERMKKEGRKNDCGRPGVNGGFIGNPNAKFGVNCVGKKHQITPEEQELMRDMRTAPQTQKEVRENKMKSYWSKKINTMNVSPFNSSRWNM
jgi:hypothetical protein